MEYKLLVRLKLIMKIIVSCLEVLIYLLINCYLGNFCIFINKEFFWFLICNIGCFFFLWIYDVVIVVEIRRSKDWLFNNGKYSRWEKMDNLYILKVFKFIFLSENWFKEYCVM